jgi:hypothetical protein
MRTLISVLLAIVICSSITSAIPRYSANYNQSCVLCHVDPSGGGARSLYGAQFFAYTELAIKKTKFEELGKVQPMLNDQIQIGFDARTMFYGKDEPGTNTFMQMQGDLYLIFQLNSQWTFYLDKGLYSGFEIWGMGHVLPMNGYIKVGQFTPPFGLRTADHKAVFRDQRGMGYTWKETGVEIGFHPRRFTFAAAVTNGQTGFQDNDEAKALTIRTDLRIPVSSLLLWIGATGRYNQIDKEVEAIVGGYGGLNFGQFSFLGEVDYREYYEIGSLYSFAQLGYNVGRGVTLKAEYDFMDPDIDLESGAESMYVVGAEFVPFGFLEVIPNFRYHDLDPEEAVDYVEAEIQFHIFF